jgi:Flp pilus assembly protein, pilin Flp
MLTITRFNQQLLREKKEMKNALSRIIRTEDGQGLVEYGLIITGIALAAIAAIWLLGPQIGQMFTDIGTQLAA